MILVSACLIGENCKYHGGNNENKKVDQFLEGKTCLPFCPELLGGLPVPREPVEIMADGKAINKIGEDVSAAFAKGAAESLRLCQDHQADLVVLKDGSPSCGVHYIYDGTFSNKTIPGMGKTARLLQKNGYKIISENDL
jgi:uncharacterized protein YbbK (DUF523 family)